mmetsp:Transcript_11595/g.15778  ORF Transcript_11595/g.15778 Transcript_11595/m.15778 type:complete len:142 (+) Transcript_11595:113-538(+)
MADLDDLEKCLAEDLNDLEVQEAEAARKMAEQLEKTRLENEAQKQLDASLSLHEEEEGIEEEIEATPARNKKKGGTGTVEKVRSPQTKSPGFRDDDIEDEIDDEATPQEEEEIIQSKLVEAKGVDLAKVPLPVDSLDLFMK